MIEGSLEVKLRTIWAYGKAVLLLATTTTATTTTATTTTSY